MRTPLSRATLLALVASRCAMVAARNTGQNYCTEDICITATHDPIHLIDSYTLSPGSGKTIPEDQFGWMAIGWGTKMADAPMVIGWPNSDGSITLSQRSTTKYAMPQIDTDPQRPASLATSSSFSNSTSTSITFTLPASSSSSLAATDIIWAYSSTNPETSSPNATIKMHTAYGTATLNLLGSLDSTVTGSGSSGTPSTAVIAHVVLGSLCTLFFLPVGALVPRIARGLTGKRWWFSTHQAVQGCLGLWCGVCAFVIGIWNFGGINSTHRYLGLALLVLILLQSGLGIAVHYVKTKPHRFTAASGRGPSNYIHMVLGVVVVCIGIWTAWKGMVDEWPNTVGGAGPGKGLKIGFWVWVGSLALSYVLGLVFLLPRQLRRERESRSTNNVRIVNLKSSNFSISRPVPVDDWEAWNGVKPQL